MGVSYQTGTLVRTGEERATLVRRTYSLVLVSVLVTIVGASFGLSQPQLMVAVAEHPFIAFFCSIAPLLMATRKKTDFPINIGLVFLFNLTIGAFGILTLYAFVSRRDFSAWGSFLMVGLWVLIGTMLLNFFFRNEAASLWLSSVAVLLFSGLLVFDTWRLRNFYGPDDYVGAAVQIYLDLLNIFMAILRVTGNRRS
jgi:FtsH-binding integral membrane protein